MHSSLYPEPSEDGETTKLNCETTVKNASVQAQLPSKFFNERLATPRVRCAVDVDEARPLRCRRSSRRPRSDRYTTETEVLASASSSGNRPKPWPSRKGAEVEELVKYMSSVPCYLQRIEKGENVQEKALNFGVIDWRRLEKWTSSQKKDQKILVSSAINLAESSSLFTNQTCSYSGCSNSNSPIQRQQTSCRSSSNSPAERKRTLSLDGNWDRSPKSRTSTESRSLWCSHEKFPESKHEYGTSMQIAAGSSIEKEKPKSCDQQSSNHDGRFRDKRFSCEKSKTLVGMRGDRKAMEVCNSLSGKLPQKYSHQSSVSRELLQSGLLSSMFQSDQSDLGSTALPTKNGVTSTKFMTINEEVKQIGKSSGNYMFNTDDQSSNQKVEGISGGRKEPLPKLSSASGLKWLNRSSSLKDVSSSHQLKDTNGLDISDDKGRSNSRGRRSPLRRILDPLLKFKYDGNSGPIASSPIQFSQEHRLNNSVSSGKESTSLYAMQKSSDASIVYSNTQMPITSHSLLQDEKYSVTMRQALVKLAWKKGQPLFMFSANDDSVLVASMRRTNRLGKEDSGGIYTIVTAEEHKKKGGIWIGLGRSGKPNLLYDVVGRMEVSCSMLSSSDSKNLEFSRQFVLVSDELLPNQGCIDSEQSSQLAAIVVKAQCKNLNGSIYKVLSRDPEFENLALEKLSSLYIESLQVEKYPEYSRACSISAILPIGIHGFSDLGKPSTLIERWKSGGSCDCGGWDEGCRLTVLADSLHEMKVASSVEVCPTTDGFRDIELFIQGGKADNKYAFRMIAFKEGLYTVEFGSSITSLQAFAICIATLHCKNSIDEDPLYENYPKMNSMQNNGGPTSYEPHHPPFSPVGRS
ncbi:uncharacterized protein LOC110114183 [Dendrobium catenatum]|uniref:Uncharacterized protein n=1 Tax=Dendrobium catenatum TaxID=906689 RepID=A0A2I0WN65_9ASPA|nr:uncharacterized protein LOC110114183 [Dendrobium catenatum]XP_028552038.1 uncharacterized protein LOC110114183 [Dendrobium catenatum]PKU77112.1 hypothetical protein MA16_Dca001718 [Dendrobium catenatum]